MRTHHCGPPLRAASSLRILRAAAFRSGATLSSRSKMIASASLSIARAIFFSLSAGTNSQLRASTFIAKAPSLRLLEQQGGARAFADQLAALVEAAVRPGDD